jgi:hypothetical protein
MFRYINENHAVGGPKSTVYGHLFDVCPKITFACFWTPTMIQTVFTDTFAIPGCRFLNSENFVDSGLVPQIRSLVGRNIQ